MKRKLVFYIVVLMLILLIGCNSTKNNEDFFDVYKAKEVGNKFMQSLTYGSISDIDKICTDNVKKQEDYKHIGENKVGAYRTEKTIEGADFAKIDYMVIRKDEENLRADLDEMSIKIIKDGNSYLIDEIKAKSNNEVYEKEGNLRITNEEIGNNNLLLRIKDLPNEVYSKGSDVVLNKKSIDNVKFSRVAIGFNGDKIGIVTSNNEKSCILLATIKESQSTLGQEESSQNNENKNNNDTDLKLEKALETPIADKVIGYDLIDGSDIKEMLFSSDDGQLIVQINNEKGSYIRVYRNSTGELLNEFGIEEKFPESKYSIRLKCVNDKGALIEIESKEDKKVENYILDLNKMEIIKDK